MCSRCAPRHCRSRGGPSTIGQEPEPALRLARHIDVEPVPDRDLRLLDDAPGAGMCRIIDTQQEASPVSCMSKPAEAASNDPGVLRGALLRESAERRRAECLAGMQAEIVQIALDQLVRQPGIEGFFGALTKTVVEEGESIACGVWLIDESGSRCELWMAYVKDALFKPKESAAPQMCPAGGRFPCEELARHLYDFTSGWTKTIE